jgi:hypothetical protein
LHVTHLSILMVRLVDGLTRCRVATSWPATA